jgi:hypothetical protein
VLERHRHWGSLLEGAYDSRRCAGSTAGVCAQSLPLAGKEEKAQREAREQDRSGLGRAAHDATVAERVARGNVDGATVRE